MTQERVNQRQEFTRETLHRRSLTAEPLGQLRIWLQEAVAAQVPDAYAFTLATVQQDGFPAARTVLLKAVDAAGLIFTSSQSPKTRDLDSHSAAAVVFYWPTLERQIRVVGRAERLTRAESQALYDVRPHAQRLALLTSEQSTVISSRAVLDEQFRQLQQGHAGTELPMPGHWGGWRIVPSKAEFWQGGVNRLHDRFVYVAQVDQGWKLDRLAP
jgi:pyridoxamine 5'-phosphate oxidase